VEFSEKPLAPATSLASALCYVLTDVDVQKVVDYAERNPGPVETGSFLEQLISQGTPVFGYVFEERWVDIGNYDDYLALNQTEIKKRLETDSTFKQPIDAVIMFADIIGSATISEYSSDEAYDDFIAEFQRKALQVVERNMQAHGVDSEDRNFCEWSVRGDELVLLLYTKRPTRDVKMAVDVAIQLKREVFLSSFNRSRQGRSFFDVGIGIHYGRVVLNRHSSTSWTGRIFNAEGYSINLTKRIEGYSRHGTFSKIILSKRFAELIITPKILSDRLHVDLKGIYGSFPVYELQVWGNVEQPEEAKKIAREDIDYYVAALENSGYDMWLSLLVARHFYDEEDYPTAEKYYEGAIKSFPDFAEGHRYLGRSFYRQNKFREAKQELESACKLEPLSSKAHNYLAITLRRLGEYSQAFKHHENATKFQQGSPYEYNAFAYTIAEAWRAHRDPGERKLYDLAKARVYWKRAEDLFGPKRDEYGYVLEHTLGMIYLAQNDHDDAIKCFERALESISKQRMMMPKKREEKRGEIFYHLGIAFQQMGGSFSKRSLEFLAKSLDSPEIEAGKRLPYYWFSDARETIREMEGSQAARSSTSAPSL
jgi:class 3 adenylate cyclase